MYNEVGKMIRKHREMRGIDQGALAEHLGTSRISVNALENGKRRLTADMAMRLGRVLGLDPVTLGAMQWKSDLDLVRRDKMDEMYRLKYLSKPLPAEEMKR